MSKDVSEAALSATYAFGWRDADSVIQISWGENQVPFAPQSLEFRSFHQQRENPAPWNGFPSFGRLMLENHSRLKSFAHGPLKALPLGPEEEKPRKDTWSSFCGQIEKSLNEKKLQKLVPARSKVFRLEKETGQRLKSELLARLFGGPQDSTYRFFLKWEDQFFFGATPELLFRKEGGSLLVPAIAGTRALKAGEEERIEQELFANAKERQEHALVVKGIKESLERLGLNPAVPPEPTFLRLRKLVHLYTPVTAMGVDIDPVTLRNALHPTAAVGGLPQKEAQAFLLNEPLIRGLFASPLLFRDPGRDICLVGIRSGLFTGSHLYLYAGAGYVTGSSPDAEWEETGRKMEALQLLLEEEKIRE